MGILSEPLNRTERFYKVDQMLHERRIVPVEMFLNELDIPRTKFKRDHNCPILNDDIGPRGFPLFFARDALRTLVAQMKAVDKSWLTAVESRRRIVVIMLIAPHKQTGTTPAVRAEIAASDEPISVLAQHYNITDSTARE
jgi:hypothetical protein